MIVWGKQLSQAFDFAGGGRARPQKGINFFCSQQVVYLRRKPLQHLLLFRLLHGFYRGDVQAIDDALHCHVAGKVPQVLLCTVGEASKCRRTQPRGSYAGRWPLQTADSGVHKAKMKDQRVSTELRYGTSPFRKIFCHNQPVFVEDISFSASQIKSFAPRSWPETPCRLRKKHPFSFCFSKYYTTGIMAQ